MAIAYGLVFQLVGMPSYLRPRLVGLWLAPRALLCAERSLCECPRTMARIRRRYRVGLELRLRSEALANAIYGTLRVARLVSYLKRKRNYRQLHL